MSHCLGRWSTYVICNSPQRDLDHRPLINFCTKAKVKKTTQKYLSLLSKLQPAQESGQAIITNTPLSQICKKTPQSPRRTNIRIISPSPLNRNSRAEDCSRLLQNYLKITLQLTPISQFSKLASCSSKSS